MLKFIQKSLDMIGLRQGSPVRSFLRQIFLFFVFLWNCLLYYPRNFYNYLYVCHVQRRYKYILKNLHAKASKNEKIAVGFYVVNDSSFSFRPLFEKMLQDDFFDPYIVIVPDTIRGKMNEIERAKQTYESLSEQYGSERLLLGYDYQNDAYSDPSDRFDIIAFANPYDIMTHEYFTMNYLSRKNVLTIYTTYGYYNLSIKFNFHHFISNFHSVSSSLFIACIWKIYLSCQYELEIYKKTSLFHGRNGVLTGFSKMDLFAKAKSNMSGRKLVILAPHHTVGHDCDNLFSLSNFLKYYNLILHLPELYPQIDFVFRPHPLLFVNLINHNIWTQQQVDEYLQKITSFSNVRYSTEGDYSQLFADSDALIHDCGSYMAEYYFTDKPQCFVVKSDNVIKKQLNELSQECISHSYKAYSEQDIIQFIENVVISENDIKFEERHNFWEHKLKYNYPNTTNYILEILKKDILEANN